MIKIFILTLLGITTIQLQGQIVTPENASKKAKKYFEEGIQQAMNNNPDMAITAFEKAIAESPNFITAYIYCADAFQQTGNHFMAHKYLDIAIQLQPDYDVGVYLKIAKSEQALMLYEEAGDHIEIFLDHPAITGETRRKAELLKESLLFAANAVKNPVEFNPNNLGTDVNSPFAEYFPSVSADNTYLVFTRNILEQLVQEDGTVTNKLNEDFFITEFIDGQWTAAQNMGKPVNTKLNEGAQNISPDGKSLYYTLCNSPEGFGSCDIYYSFKIGDQWTYPENAGRNINSGNWDSQPSVSADGNQLYFTSNRPGGLGGADIYISTLDAEGYWQKPENAGPVINTAEDDKSPFIHPDGRTLYFSSAGHPGMGGSDLFITRKDAEGNWQKPENLGYPINTSGDETTLSLSADGNNAYFASNREEGLGELDLYSFIMPNEFRPEPVTYVKATVKDAQTGKALKSQIQLIALNNNVEIITSFSDDKTGEFLVCIPIGSDYGLFVQKEGYLYHSENFSLSESTPDKPFVLEILLQPISAGELITLRNIFFETGSAALLEASQTELYKALDILIKNPAIAVRINGHTDNVGSDADNLQLSMDRALTVKQFFLSKGINANRLTHAGFGESKPIDTNETEQGRAKNRRTEMEIISL